MDAGHFNQHVYEALNRIWAGERAADCEDATLDFKEEPTRHNYGTDQRVKDKLKDLITDACICFANGEEEYAYLILGVSDKARGPEAFRGTSADVHSLRQAVYDRTQPKFQVHAEELIFHDKRLIVFTVPRGLSVIQRTNGSATYRVKDACLPLGPEELRRLQHRRSNPDYTFYQSTLDLNDLSPEALAYGKSLYQRRVTAEQKPLNVPLTDEDFLTVLGLILPNGKLTLAAEILFSPARNGLRAQYLLKKFSLFDDPEIYDFSGPLVELIPQLLAKINEAASGQVATVVFPNGQEIRIPRFPARAIDEVIYNAFAHRNWQLKAPVVIEQSPQELRIISPGGFPQGVNENTVLGTASYPVNECLMQALRILGLVERASQGFSRMWSAMLETGREAPVVTEENYHVSVTLDSGKPRVDFIQALAALREHFPEHILNNVGSLIIIRQLCDFNVITVTKAQQLTQRDARVVRQYFDLLEEHGLVQPVGYNKDQWALSERAYTVVSKFIQIPVTIGNLPDWVENQLASGVSLSNKDIVQRTGLDPQEVTAVLRYLHGAGKIMKDPTGPSRGPTVRWIKA
ncbi:MAG: ATP-binding protein [Corynebacterium sp.]|uniref:ATP-binding protein n=1 Tax=Corynebacterium sp. TaxID=1720 RepID=UPI0026DCF799|nr:ATP-binding protein [Corynebacterium sp.]MDO4761640.1 ATP-binding protein [Corynebacterium sp.]